MTEIYEVEYDDEDQDNALTVAQLVEKLQTLPQDARVRILWDGACRSSAEAAWLAQDGDVGIGPADETIYSDSDRPVGAPAAAETPYYRLSDEA